MEKKGINENIIVAIIMVLTVVCLLVFVGFTPIKEWLSTPLVWDEPEDIGLYFIGVKENPTRKELTLKFVLDNDLTEKLNSARFLVNLDGIEFELSTPYSASPMENLVIEKTMSTGSIVGIDVDQETYDYYKTVKTEDVTMTYKTLYMECNYEKVVDNTKGTVKILLIAGVSLVLFLLGLCKFFPKWMRIILKSCGLPALIALLGVLILIGLFAGGGGSSNSGSDSRQESAERRYKNAANHKAGAQMRGDTANAARAQRKMDNAMADMIGSGKSADNTAFRSAQERYKRAAGHKAGARIHGNTADAARAQAEMDKAMADMIKNK